VVIIFITKLGLGFASSAPTYIKFIRGHVIFREIRLSDLRLKDLIKPVIPAVFLAGI